MFHRKLQHQRIKIIFPRNESFNSFHVLFPHISSVSMILFLPLGSACLCLCLFTTLLETNDEFVCT